MFGKNNHTQTAILAPGLSPEETSLITHIVPPAIPPMLELRETFTPESPGEAGELYGGSSGFLVRLIPFLMIWGGLSLGMVWRFGTNPLVFLGFAMLTAVIFWCFRQQDYAHSPAGERTHARNKLAKLKKQEMTQLYTLQNTVVKSTTRTR